MRRLYLQIYLTFVAIFVLFGVLASVAWILLPETSHDRRVLAGTAALVGDLLPGPDRPATELRAALQRLADRLGADLAVRAPDGALLAAAGDPLPVPAPDWDESRWLRSRGRGFTVALLLPDGRWLIARHVPAGHPVGWLVVLGLLAAAIAVGAYPVVRRITGRLERLQERVDALAGGDLSTRVEVEGRDEVANLARSFNRAADRIQWLVDAQRGILASASHELRSPLARMRVAIELLAGDDRPELRACVARDIAELDDLIGELLLASRLDAVDQIERVENVDLLALVAEEAARSGACVTGDPVRILGDHRMLRRLVRNLLENARRYGNGTAVEVSVTRSQEGARLRVEDRGAGVPEAERERIFEPFYRPAGMSESADGGVGLGLFLVRQIARHHGGEARCLQRQGGGTSFEVTLRAG